MMPGHRLAPPDLTPAPVPRVRLGGWPPPQARPARGDAVSEVVVAIPLHVSARQRLDPERTARFRQMSKDLKDAADVAIGLGGSNLALPSNEWALKYPPASRKRPPDRIELIVRVSQLVCTRQEPTRINAPDIDLSSFTSCLQMPAMVAKSRGIGFNNVSNYATTNRHSSTSVRFPSALLHSMVIISVITAAGCNRSVRFGRLRRRRRTRSSRLRPGSGNRGPFWPRLPLQSAYRRRNTCRCCARIAPVPGPLALLPPARHC